MAAPDEVRTKTSIITPAALEIDAVVPQCLDNQYITDSVYSAITKRGKSPVDFRHDSVRQLREQAFRTEFIRSLVYSSQLVVQRAFFKNSDFLYRNYLPDDPDNLLAFASLLREGAIVPFLFREVSLYDGLVFDIHVEGDRATQAMLREVGDEVICVRLGRTDAENEPRAASMETAFGAGLSRIAHLKPVQRNAMASELFSDSGDLQRLGAWEAFDKSLTELAVYATMRGAELSAKGEALTRQIVYQDKFVLDRDVVRKGPDDRVKYGQLRGPDEKNQFPFELKKYVDLVYNVNLPDHLGRYTFTPLGLPSRMALQDAPGQGYGHDEIREIVTDEAGLEYLRRAFRANTQKAMTLPFLADLTIADVVQIRGLPEWSEFKDAQSGILRDPLRVLDRMEQFERAFDRFQQALSEWYDERYGRVETERRYCSFVSLAISLAGKLLVAGSNLGVHEKVAAGAAVDILGGRIPEKAKGFAAKLMVGVYDIGAKKLDANRTYSIELMQTHEQLLREDVIELLDAIQRREESRLPQAQDQVPDQGIK